MNISALGDPFGGSVAEIAENTCRLPKKERRMFSPLRHISRHLLKKVLLACAKMEYVRETFSNFALDRVYGFEGFRL